MLKKQVNSSHYAFGDYFTVERWASIWHQVNEVRRFSPNQVLEIGPGAGAFKALATIAGITVDTLDLDPDLRPDYVGSALSLPFENCSYDVVCAFQMLEHLPYEEALASFAEMVRVSRIATVISLPDSRSIWQYRIDLPYFGRLEFSFERPVMFPREHVFDGEHYWELGKKSYSAKKVASDFSAIAKLVKSFRVKENPYHRFLVFQRD